MTRDEDRMDWSQRSALIGKIVEEATRAGVACNEHRLQTYIFLLQEGLGLPFGYDYRMPKTTPRSRNLASDLVEMEADGILDIAVPADAAAPTYVFKKNGRAREGPHRDLVSAAREPIRTVLASLKDHPLDEIEALGRNLYHAESPGEEEPPSDQQPARAVELATELGLDEIGGHGGAPKRPPRAEALD